MTADAVLRRATPLTAAALALAVGLGACRPAATDPSAAPMPRPPVEVAVVDTGVAPVGAVERRLVPGVACTPTCTSSPAGDGDGHGTAVAELLATGGDPTGEPAPVEVVPIRVGDERGTLSIDGVAAGIRWAARRGTPIVALPLVFGGASPAVAEAIREAPETLFVVPAGNDGLDVDDRSVAVHPCVDPAPNIVCVTAGHPDGRLGDASNRGRISVDLVAPGVDLVTVDPAGRMIRVSGSSYAVPVAARAATTLLSERPGAGAPALADALRCGHRTAGTGDRTVGGVLDLGRARTALRTGRCPTG